MSTTRQVPRASVELTGAMIGSGTIAGKGALTLSLADAAQAGLSIETGPDGTTVQLSTAVGMKIRKGRELVLSGDLARIMENKTVEGDLGATLKLSKDVDVSVSRKLKPGDDVTAVTVTIRF